jgi:hypothetical protein
MSRCAARQHSDMMHCVRCGISWDTNDEAPPRCKPEPQQEPPRNERIIQGFENLKRELRPNS